MVTVMPAIVAVKCSPMNTTETSISSTRVAWTKATGSSLATSAIARSRNETDFAYISFTCMRNIVLTSAPSAENASRSRPVSINTCGSTVGSVRTSAPTASRRSRPRPYCARTCASTAARSLSSAATAAKRSPRTPPTIVTWGARTPRRSRASVSTAARRSLSRTNWSSTWTCTRGKNLTLVSAAVVASRVRRPGTDTGQTLIVQRERTEPRRWWSVAPVN